jgi:hypothetical protein
MFQSHRESTGLRGLTLSFTGTAGGNAEAA